MNGADFAPVFAGAVKPDAAGGGVLVLPDWRVDDWRKLLSGTRVQPFRTSEMLIHRGTTDRALYFVAAGVLEVGVTTFGGVSVNSLARIGEKSVVGEQSFFDGEPRSANVWAVNDGTLLRWDLDEFRRFGEDEPHLARDVLFALARILSSRLRMTTTRIRR